MGTVLRHSHRRVLVVGNNIKENIVVDLSFPSLFTSHVDRIDAVAEEGTVADRHVFAGIDPNTVESGVKNAVFNKHSVRTVPQKLNVAHPPGLNQDGGRNSCGE